jgi:hypothetical protein
MRSVTVLKRRGYSRVKFTAAASGTESVTYEKDA